MKRLTLTLLILLGPSVAHASLANVYIADASAGGNTGADCANAFAKTFFTTAGNWGAGGSQIGSDTIVHLCGTITGTAGATGLTFQGSGTSGHPVTLLFESGASMQAPYWGSGSNAGDTSTGAIVASGKSFVVIDGGTNGVVENTLNGTSGGTCLGGTCTQNHDSNGVTLINCTSCTVQNLSVIDIYVRTSTSDEVNYGRGISKQGCATNLTINHVIIHDMNAAIFYDGPSGCSDTNFTLENSEIYSASGGLQVGFGSGSSGTLAGLLLDTLYIHDFNTWNDPSPPYDFHHDGVHIWTFSGTHVTGIQFSNSKCGGDMGSATACFYLENYSTLTVDLKLFNDVFYETVTTCLFACGPNSLWLQNSASSDVITAKIYNNTFAGANSNIGGITVEGTTGINYELINNTVNNYGTLLHIQPGAPFPLTTSDYNNWGSLNGSHIIRNENGGGDATTLANWRTQCSCDSHAFTTAPNINSSTYVPNSGSPLITTGLDLTSKSITALDSDAAGVARPNGSAWDIGAFQFASGGGTTVTYGMFSAHAPGQ